MNINFNKVWASDTSPDYPSDAQAKRGLSYLGTEPPTFDLHDAIFQRLDSKALWLYDQVRTACERFGQKVQNDDGSLVSDARDIMANAITYALLNQRKADEGGHGIVRMANYEQTQGGNEHNLAVSPAHLKEYFEKYNTWENTKDKPQTALRWPSWEEVSEKPTWGEAAWKGYFDTGDASQVRYGLEVSSIGAVASVRDAAYAKIESTSKKVDDAAAAINNKISAYGNSVYANVFDGDYGITWKYLPFLGVKAVVSTGALRNIIEKLDNDIFSRLHSSAFVDIFDTGDAASVPYGASMTASTGALAAVRDWSADKIESLSLAVNNKLNSYGNSVYANVFDTGNAADIPYGAASVTSTGAVASVRDNLKEEIKTVKNSLGDAASRGFFDTGNAADIPYGSSMAASTGAVASVRDQSVSDIRWGAQSDPVTWHNAEYMALKDNVISAIQITGNVDGQSDYVYFRYLQKKIGGQWLTVEFV